ncbi:MAG: GDP-mannose 4,6-dehydratase [Acidobacteria bacterium]|nr:MAG: GDP-mannose 4,6-dehydratase [Acidobacteriota bacterium]
MNKRSALIIGISGQDGGYLARLLLDKGYEVYGSSRDHEVAPFTNLVELGIKDRIHLLSMTLADFRSVVTTLQTAHPDEIYNLAGQSSVGLSFRYPVETFESISVGTINILECLRLFKHPAKLYNAGSSEVFGNTKTPASETTPFQPRSPYATAKAAAHYAVTNYREAYNLFVCSGMLFNHESPLRPPRFVTRKIVTAAVRIAKGSEERLQLGNLDIKRDWGWAPEYVEMMWLMLQQDHPDDFVIATGTLYSLTDFVSNAFEAVDLDWREHVDIDSSLFRPSDVEYSVGNPAKAEKQLCWKARVKGRELTCKLVEAELAKNGAIAATA